MRIEVQEKNSRPIRILFPSGLVLNQLAATVAAPFINRALQKNQKSLSLSPAQLRRLVRTLNRYRHRHPDWVLAEVSSAEGEKVLVKL